MKTFVKIGKAINLAMCMALVLTLAAGCSKDDNDPRDAYVGTFTVIDKATIDGTIRSQTHNISITKSSLNPNDILISNPLDFGAGISVNAIVSGNTFVIPQQTVSSEMVGLSGSGARDGNSLKFSILATFQIQGQVNFTCDASKL